MQIISQGAEATIVEDKGLIIKSRLPKTYRLKELDDKLRKSRTKKEIKVLQKLEGISFPSPRVISSDLRKMTITMSKIEGKPVSRTDIKILSEKIFHEIGKYVATLHNENIIHGDLTTSNIMLTPDKELFFIDFGLSSNSRKIEDRAVEIHLFFQALESTHHTIIDKSFQAFLSGYKEVSSDYEEIMIRYKKVILRGRYKQKENNK